MRGGRHPPRRRREARDRRGRRHAAAGEPGDAVPNHGDRQRPRDRAAADPEDLREAPLRLQVPPAPHESRPAGHRDLSGRHVRPAHDRQAGADHLAHQSEDGCALLRGPDRYEEERADRSREQEDRLGPAARDAGRARGGREVPEGAHIGGRVPGADLDRQPARVAHLSHGGRRDQGLPAHGSGASGAAARDQAPPVRHRARHAAQDAARHQ